MLKIVVVCVGLFSWTKREKGILPVILRRFLKVFVAKMQPTAVICLELYAAHANTEWKENGEEEEEVPVEPSDLQQIKTTREASCQTDKLDATTGKVKQKRVRV